MITFTKAAVVALLCLAIAPGAHAVVSQPPGHYAYIANVGSGAVSFIDTDTRTVTHTTTVGGQPAGVAVGPSGFYVYVTNLGSRTVSKISTVTGNVVATIPTGATSMGIAVNNDETLAYVTDFSSTRVLIIDLATNAVVKSVTVGNSPFGIAMDPAGQYLYVANRGSNTVSVMTSSGVVAGTVPVGSAPYGIAVHPSGSSIWVTSEYSDTVSVINRHDWSVTTIPVGDEPIGICFNRAGTYAYVTNYTSNTVSVIKTATKAVTATILVGAQPFGAGMDRSDRYLYVPNAVSNNVTVIDTTTTPISVVASIPVGVSPIAPGQFINASSLWTSAASASLRATYPEEDAKGLVKLKTSTQTLEGTCSLYATYRKPVKLSCAFTDGTSFDLDNMSHLATENPKAKTETVILNGNGRGAVFLSSTRYFPGFATLTDGKGTLRKDTVAGEVTSIVLTGKLTIHGDTGAVGTANLKFEFTKP